MRIAVVHNAVSDQSDPDERDVLVQADAVCTALKKLGHQPILLGCTLNLSSIHNRLNNIQPDIVFNLVESLNGSGRLIHLFPALLDVMGTPYTGSKTDALYFTSNKILAKSRMREARLSTPPWIGPCPPDMTSLEEHKGLARSSTTKNQKIQWIVKSLWEHASIGLNEAELFLNEDADQLRTLLPKRAPQLGGACFAEAYIEGREFNISLLAGPDGPQALSPAEILFEDYPADKLRVVGYRAKWDEHSYEYNHTPRHFDFPPQDTPLLLKLKKMAHRCWPLFGLNGYARVDFRVDSDGEPWILEINANPCLSLDAGFAAALKESGLSFTEAVRQILMAALGRNKN
jgi:D-alanine-D-alanine ligase